MVKFSRFFVRGIVVYFKKKLYLACSGGGSQTISTTSGVWNLHEMFFGASVGTPGIFLKCQFTFNWADFRFKCLPSSLFTKSVLIEKVQSKFMQQCKIHSQVLFIKFRYLWWMERKLEQCSNCTLSYKKRDNLRIYYGGEDILVATPTFTFLQLLIYTGFKLQCRCYAFFCKIMFIFRNCPSVLILKKILFEQSLLCEQVS